MTDRAAGWCKGKKNPKKNSSFLFIKLVSQEEASCCQGGQLNEAVGEMKDLHVEL